MKLKNKVAVITGGCNGIGLAIAKLFSENGAKVAILDKETNQEKIAYAKKYLGADCFVEQGDISNMSHLESFYKKIQETYGFIDIVVANAAIHGKGSMGSITEDQFDHVISVNFKGTYFTVTKSLPLLKEGGSIVLISSVTADFGFQEMSLYGATKASIRYLSKAFSAELALKNIRVNCISPGLINTDMPFEGYPINKREEVLNEKIKNVPLNCIGDPKEIANAALFFASDDSKYVTGQNINIDGGMASIFKLSKKILNETLD